MSSFAFSRSFSTRLSSANCHAVQVSSRITERMKMPQKTFTTIRTLLMKIGGSLVGLGFISVLLIGILSFTGLQQFWIWYELLIKLSTAMVIGGITIVLTFATWIQFERNTRRIQVLDAVFNYGVMFLVFGGGIAYLVGVFWLNNEALILVAMRCYVFGVFILLEFR